MDIHDNTEDVPGEMIEHDDDADATGYPALPAIRSACVRCQGNPSNTERRAALERVSECEVQSCPLWMFRFGRKPDPAKVDPTTLMQPVERGLLADFLLKHKRQRRTAIRMRCLECVCFERREIAACTTWKCDLYPFRLGTGHPVDKGNVEERRALWHRIGHDAYVRVMNDLLCSANDADALE